MNFLVNDIFLLSITLMAIFLFLQPTLIKHNLVEVCRAVKTFSVLALLFYFPLAMAAETGDVVSYEQIVKTITEFVKNYGSFDGTMRAAIIISILIQVLKSQHLGGWFEKRSPLVKRLVVSSLGVVYGIVYSIAGGQGWLEAIVDGLIGSQGAMLIWTNVKPLLPKKKE